MIDTRGCEGCDHWKPVGWKKKTAKGPKCCHYLLDTGHCRSVICPTGLLCTVRSVNGVIELADRSKEYDDGNKRKRAPLEKYKELYQKGLYDEEIAAKTGTSRTSVGKWRRSRGLETNRRLQKEKEKKEKKPKKRKRKTGDPCKRCYSRSVCQSMGGTCNEKSRWVS